MSVVATEPLVLPIPDFVLHDDDVVELGARVAFTHRAAVARWRRIYSEAPESAWHLYEGTDKGWRPAMSAPPADRDVLDIEFGFVSDPFYARRGDPSVNKTVMVWPEDGEGFVFGLVRRGIGQSYSASGGDGGMFNDDWEPGGFAAHAYVPLYAVKTQLRGTGYLLVPTWAVRPLVADQLALDVGAAAPIVSSRMILVNGDTGEVGGSRRMAACGCLTCGLRAIRDPAAKRLYEVVYCIGSPGAGGLLYCLDHANVELRTRGLPTIPE